MGQLITDQGGTLYADDVLYSWYLKTQRRNVEYMNCL